MENGLHIADIIIIILYMLLCLVLGLYKSRAVLNIKEYAIGNGSFNDVVLISTIFATFADASYTIGTVDKVYTTGLLFALPRMFAPLFWLITLRIFAVNIETFKGCITISDIMGRLYGAAGQWVTNIAALIVAIVATSIQALAVGQILHYFLGISLVHAVIVGMLITTMYSAFGGIRSIVLTDVLQFGIFMVAIPIACSFLYNDLGGYSEIMEKTPPKHLELDLGNSANLIFFVSLIIYGLVPDVGSAFVQRFLMASGKKQLVKVLKIVTLVNIPFLAILCMTGFLMQVKAPNIPSDTAFVYFIDHYLSPGIKGLLVIGLLSILMSTADSWLNFAGVLTAHDVTKRIFPKMTDKQELMVARATTLFIGFIAINLALYGKGLVELDWLASNFWEPLILIPLIAGFLHFKTNHTSYIASAICGVSCTSLMAYIQEDFNLISFITGLTGSAIGLFCMHYFQIYRGSLIIERKEAAVNKTRRIKFKIIVKLQLCLKNILRQLVFYINHQYLIRDLIKGRVRKNEIRHYTFSIFVIFYYLIPFFIANITFSDPENVLLYFRILAIFLCIGLIFADYWPNAIKKKCFAFYWYFSLLFCLPFVATYTFFIAEMDGFWLLNTVLSIILLGLLVDSISFIILTSIGVLFGYACYITLNVSHVHNVVPSHDIYLIGYLYVFLVLMIVVFIRGKEKAEASKVTQMEIFGGAIAHEVKTPLAAIQMLAETLEIITSDLKMRAVRSDVNNEVQYQCTLDERDFHILFDFLPKNLSNTSKEGQKVVEFLLLLLKHKAPQDDKYHSMRDSIKDALDVYIMTNALNRTERNRISFDGANDFYFCGPKQYIKQIINNLMNNSFKYAGKDAQIRIWLEEDHSIHFRDDGRGIAQDMLSKLFQPFYTVNASGNGIGLAFCEILVSNMGGTIECSSDEGVFTEFIIRLPTA